ncbi:hypothetical protein [Murinocardiopsis flavida]|nr:hypothetical protein [Murinocardiopsis flavida]
MGPPPHSGWVPPPREPRPGVVALRPLTLGDIFNGTFAYMRENPKATLGISVLVIGLASILPAFGSAVLLGELSSLTAAPPSNVDNPDELLDELLATGAFGFGAILAGLLVNAIAVLVLSGLLAGVIGRAVLGHRLSFGDAIAAVNGRIGAILGLGAVQLLIYFLMIAIAGGVTVLNVAVIAATWQSTEWYVFIPMVLLSVFAYVAFYAWIMNKFALAMPAVVLERIGPFSALGRSWALTRRSWWRVFLILLLSQVLVSVVGSILNFPFSMVNQAAPLGGDAAWVGITVGVATFLGTAVSGAVTSPFLAGVTTLLYVDMRMRREGFDLELQTATRGGHESVGAEVYLRDRPRPYGEQYGAPH